MTSPSSVRYTGSQLLNAVQYALGGLVQRGGQFLLLPLLVGTLTPANFTRYGLFASAVALAPVILTLNAPSAGPRLAYYFNASGWRSLFKRSLVIGALMGGAGLGLILAVARLVLPELWAAGAIESAAFLLAMIGAVLGSHCMSVARVVGDAPLFNLAAISRTATMLVAYLGAIAVGVAGYDAAVVAIAAGYLTGGVGATIWAYGVRLAAQVAKIASKEGSPGPASVYEVVRFSGPTAVNFLAVWLMNQSGRWIGAGFIGLEEIADYTLLMLLLSGVGMLTRAIFDGALPEYSAALVRGDVREGLRSLRSSALLALLAVGSAMPVLMGLMQLPLVPAEYRFSWPLFSLALTALIVDVGYVASVQVLIVLKKTGDQAVVAVLAGTVSFAAALGLVRTVGEPGLLVATVVGYLVLLSGSGWRARRALRATG